jgi:hypothetical protein
MRRVPGFLPAETSEFAAEDDVLLEWDVLILRRSEAFALYEAALNAPEAGMPAAADAYETFLNAQIAAETPAATLLRLLAQDMAEHVALLRTQAQPPPSAVVHIAERLAALTHDWAAALEVEQVRAAYPNARVMQTNCTKWPH